MNDEKYNRNRVARLYLPLINIISSHLTHLFDPGNASFGQLNRPSIAPTDESLNSTSDDLTTDPDGSLVRFISSLLFSSNQMFSFRNVDPH